MLLIAGACGRNESSTPLPAPTDRPTPSTVPFQDLLPSDTALAVAVPRLGAAFTGASAMLIGLHGGDSAGALLRTSTGVQGDADAWMDTHGIDPNGPAMFFFRMPSDDVSIPFVIRTVAVMRALNTSQFVQTAGSGTDTSFLHADTIGDWALLGNDPEFMKAIAAKLDAAHRDNTRISFETDGRWYGLVRTTGMRAPLEAYVKQASTSTPAFLRTPLAEFTQSLSNALADSEPIPFTADVTEKGFSYEMTWNPDTHPALAAWLGTPSLATAPLDTQNDRGGTALAIQLFPALRSLVVGVLRATAEQMNDTDATAAAETLAATLGTTACFRIDGDAMALGWTVTDHARVHDLYRAMLPPDRSSQPIPYESLTIDTVRVVDPLFVTAGNGMAAIGTGLSAVQDAIDTLRRLSDRRDSSSGGIRLEVQTPIPPPIDRIRRGLTPASAGAAIPPDQPEPALKATWTEAAGVDRVRISVEWAAAES